MLDPIVRLFRTGTTTVPHQRAGSRITVSVPARVKLIDKKRWISGILENISVEGANVVAMERLRKGDLVLVSARPSIDFTISVVCRVVNARKRANGGQWSYGLRFMHLAQREQERLTKFMRGYQWHPAPSDPRAEPA